MTVDGGRNGGGAFEATATAGDDTLPAAPPRPGLGPGAAIGRYRVEGQIGAGGMGVVYRARDTELDRAVALKLVRPHGNIDELTERLRRESRLQARAAHAAVITVYDIGRDGDQVYVAMELIEGATLTRWLADATRSWRDILDVFRRAGEGLAAAHASGLVHRDFKPDNVLVELREGRVTRVLVSDFGVARAVEDADAPSTRASAAAIGMTATGAIVGTPAYMSPEQLDAQPADERADVFSFCVALWEALFGERPFRGSTLRELIAAFEQVPVVPAGRGVPRWLVRVVRRGLAIDRDARMASMVALLAELDWRKHRRRRIAGVIASVATLGAIAAIVATRLFAPAAEVSACRLPADVDSRIAAAGEAIGNELAVDSPVLATRWRDSTAVYARQWTQLRALACAAWSEDQVRCVDRMGARDVALLEAARGASPERRAALLRGIGTLVAPHECLSAAAAELAAHTPDTPAIQAARVAITYAVGTFLGDRSSGETAFGVARAFVALAGDDAVRGELAAQEAMTIAPHEPGLLEVRRAAQAAERAGDYARSSFLWLGSLQGTETSNDLLLSADNALTRAGNPPLRRALWYAYRAATATLNGKQDAAREDLAHAHAIMRRIEAPVDLRLGEALANVQMRLGDYADAAGSFAAVKALALEMGRANVGLARIRTQLARALAWADRTQEATAEIADLLAGLDPSRPLPDAMYVRAVHLYAEIASWTDPAEALRRLEQWDRALDGALGPDDLWRGHIEATRTLALTNLERFAEAERSGRRALEIELINSGPSSGNTAEQRLILGQILGELGRRADAEELLRRGIRDLAAATREDNPRVAQASYILGEILARDGRFTEARPLAETALPVYERGSGGLTVWERGRVEWLLARSIRHVASDPARERGLVVKAIADLASDGNPRDADLLAARARLRQLAR